MNSRQEIPLRLKIVAMLFMLFGAMDTVKMILAPFQDRFTINTGPLVVLVGFGLLALRPGWRTCGLVLLWIPLVFLPIVVIAGLANGEPATFKLFGQEIGQVPLFLFIPYMGAFWCLSLWEYRVLTESDVRALFVRDARSNSPDGLSEHNDLS